MKVQPESNIGRISPYNNINRNKIAFNSLVYNPNSILHRVNPVIRYMDNFFQLSLKASRNFWHAPIEAIKPYIKEITVQDKRTPYIKIWDINKDDRKKYLIIMHGLSHNITSLQDLYANVLHKTEYAILAPEYHGFDAGNKEFIYMSPKKILRGTTAALKYLKDKGIKEEDICLCGHSFGGFAATELAEKNPNLHRLILISSTNTDKHWANAIRNGHPIGVPASIQEKVSKSNLYTWPLSVVFNTARRLKKVRVPVDIIHGKKDQRVDVSTADYLSKKCRNLNSFHILENSSHRMDPDKVQQLITLLNN